MKLVILLAVTLAATLSVDGARLRRQLEREETVDPVLVPTRDADDDDNEDGRPPMDVVIVDKNGDGSMTDTRYDLIPAQSGAGSAAAAAAEPDKKVDDVKPTPKPEDLDINVDEDEGKFSVSGHMPEVEHFHGSMPDMFHLMGRRFDDMFRRVALAFGSAEHSGEEDEGPILVRIPIGGVGEEGDLEIAHSSGGDSSEEVGHQPGDGCGPCAHLFGAAGHGIHRMPASPFVNGPANGPFGGRPSFGGGRPLFGSGRPSYGAGRPSYGSGRPMLGAGGFGGFGPGLLDAFGGMEGLGGSGEDDLPTNYNHTKTELITMHGRQFLKKTKTIRKGSPGAQIHITSVSYVPIDETENEEPGSVSDDLPPVSPLAPGADPKNPLKPDESAASNSPTREILADLPPIDLPAPVMMASQKPSDDMRKPTAQSDIPPPA